ncbi:3-phosphoshikimate 1-carboxyvinyltransferase [Dactylosporangium aurantiacum]|uniref:3-phosphoshikimate 1-carboxyvinyltransferase n=1 Tax=Dactylosporangium aurantiacum TaxID=35754 RepID=A0A9Q9MGI9_9ACTN|nr:3-phosphoshikimate 1-carboxyvinyltransferase [Dactylosporangium aurantiacum]MDG6104840.1 3-phosphoshikimate 1-carboxyvinyltransferase [Dactylosporangium aurantiacum]UWZ55614.1 3-phosphoshikimate 1-carboxyvinyltransferase [Dactylosporangium aurantiacum]
MPNLTAPAHLPWTAPTAPGPVTATVRLPGSKSMTARALVLGALSLGATTLRAPLRARDTELMAAGLRAMGCHVSTADDNLWLLRPRPLRGPARVDVGGAGTVLRFLPPIAALADGAVVFDGDGRSRTRPMAPLVGALRDLGARVDYGGGLPLTVHGIGRLTGGEVTMDASASSQLVSGLLLAAPEFDRGVVVRHAGPPVPRAPHLRMTVQMLRAAGAGVDDGRPDVWVVEPGRLNGRAWDIEPDLPAAAAFLAAALVTGGTVTVAGWPRSGLQPGGRLLELLRRMGGAPTLTRQGLVMRGTGTVHGITADLADAAELIPVLAALAAVADGPSHLHGVAHLDGHETDRIAALVTALGALGADVTRDHDGLRIRPRPLRGATVATRDDHRLAHAAAVLGLAVDGVRLDDVTCTAKTLPEFPRLWSTMVHGAASFGGQD